MLLFLCSDEDRRSGQAFVHSAGSLFLDIKIKSLQLSYVSKKTDSANCLSIMNSRFKPATDRLVQEVCAILDLVIEFDCLQSEQ